MKKAIQNPMKTHPGKLQSTVYYYPEEIIEFVLRTIYTRKKSISQIEREYKIPRTTIYSWIE
ncbi:hypothetical protein [Chryseobacterium daeguense]|uniref:hypothetical protein n=1 Tax=Chryseobacterium daeguense TaxID=412438 RepID=UPI00041D304D|nr:hypothetical protein [Chryseobacterium daeguense]